MTADWLTWNDCTIPRLAQSIFDDRRFDLMPILADALEESCYPGDPAQFRVPLTPVQAIRLLAPIIGGELLESVQWIESFVGQLEPNGYDGERPAPTYEEVMDAATTGDGMVQQGGEGWRENWYNHSETFWKHYEVVAGPAERKDDFYFGCSC